MCVHTLSQDLRRAKHLTQGGGGHSFRLPGEARPIDRNAEIMSSDKPIPFGAGRVVISAALR